MPKLPQYYSQRRMEAAGGIPAYSPSGQGEEEARLGHVLTDFGLTVLEEVERDASIDEFNTYQYETVSDFNNYMNSLDPKGNPDNYLKDFDTVLQNRRQALEGLKHGMARQRAAAWFGDTVPAWQNRIFWHTYDIAADQRKARLEAQVMGYMNMAASAGSQEEYEHYASMMTKTIQEASGAGQLPGGFALLSKDEANLMIAKSLGSLQPHRNGIIQQRQKEALNASVRQASQVAANMEISAMGLGYYAVPYESESGEPGLDFVPSQKGDGLKYLMEVGDRENWTDTVQNDAKSLYEGRIAQAVYQQEKAIEDFKKDFGERLDNAPIDQLTDMISEVRANNRLSEGDQTSLVKDVNNRLKYVKEGSNVITDRLLLDDLTTRATYVDPDSDDYQKLIDEIDENVRIGFRNPYDSKALNYDDAQELKKLARARMAEGHKSVYALAVEGANDLVEPVGKFNTQEWLADRRVRGLPYEGKEVTELWYEKIADQGIAEYRQSLQEDISRYAKNEMFQYEQAHTKDKPSDVQRELELIKGRWRRLRDESIERMELEVYGRQGIISTDRDEARLNAIIENYNSRHENELSKEDSEKVKEKIIQKWQGLKSNRQVTMAGPYGLQQTQSTLPQKESKKVDYVQQLDQWMKTQSNMDSLPEDLVTDLQTALRAVGNGADAKKVFQDILDVYSDNEYLKTHTREEQVSLRQFYAQLLDPIVK